MNPKLSFLLILVAVLLCLPAHLQARPVISLSFEGLEVAFDEIDVVEEFVVDLANDGEGELVWQTWLDVVREPWRPGPGRDDPGDLIGQFQGLNAANRQCSPVGWDADNECMWITSIAPNQVAAFTHDSEYQNFEEVLRIDPGQCSDGAWANGFLYLPPIWSNQLNRYNANGQNVGVAEMPFSIVGVAADDERDWLFLMNGDDLTIHVFQLRENGDVGDEIGVIDDHLPFHRNAPSYSLEWVAGQIDGQLWMTDLQGEVHQISVDTDDWSCMEEVQHFLAFPDGEEEPESGVAYDGQNLWAGGFSEDNIRIYDDGVTEAIWLTWEPREGRTPSGADENVVITINSTGMLAGQYEADLHFISNDFNNPDAILHITATFVGVPRLEVIWPVEAGYPDIIDFNRYGDVWVGHQAVLPVTIWNRGTDDLSVQGVNFGAEFFQFEPEAFVLAPHHRRIVNLTFTNDSSEVVVDSLHLLCNVPGAEEFIAPVQAQAIFPPVISVDRQEIELDLGLGETDDELIGIANEGGSTLRWIADLDTVPWPGRDAPAGASVTIDPRVGTVQPGEQMDVRLHFELTEFDTVGDAFTLTIQSNDPDRPLTVIEILIHSNDVGSDEGVLIPHQLSLAAIHPNPFNSTAIIEYSLPSRTQVEIALLDLQGRELLRFGEGMREAGSHQFVVDARQLPAGCYLVKLQAGSEVQLAKAVIVK